MRVQTDHYGSIEHIEMQWSIWHERSCGICLQRILIPTWLDGWLYAFVHLHSRTVHYNIDWAVIARSLSSRPAICIYKIHDTTSATVRRVRCDNRQRLAHCSTNCSQKPLLMGTRQWIASVFYTQNAKMAGRLVCNHSGWFEHRSQPSKEIFR